MRKQLLSLGAGALLGVCAGWATRGGEPEPSPLPPQAIRGASGPGLSCPARAVEEEVACDPGAELRSLLPALPPALAEGPTCSTRSTAAHLFIDETGLVHAAEPDDLFWFARYQGQPPEPIGDASVINGVPMRVAQLATLDSPEQVLRFFKAQFEANHIAPMQGLPHGPSGPLYLSFTPTDGVMRTLILVPPQEGESTIILASVGTPKVGEQQAPGELPTPDGTESFRIDEIRDGPTRQRNVTFQVPKHKLEEVRDFYLAELPRRGYSADASKDPQLEDGVRSWHQIFVRAGENLSITLTHREGKPVLVSMIWIDNNPISEGSNR